MGTTGALLLLAAGSASGESIDVAAHVKTLHAVGPKGQGNREATEAWKTLARAEASQLPELLAGLDGAAPLAANYLRAAIDAVAERELARGGKLPAADLEKFLLDQKHNPRGRRLAYEWLTKVDPAAPTRIIPQMLTDTSLELRRDAVKQVLDQADVDLKAERKDEAKAGYQKALAAARELDQVQLATDKLRKLGGEVDLPVHFGFVMNWKLIGPFDNTNQAAFHTVYPPEKEFNPAATYPGKGDKPVKWIDHTTTDEMGTVDLTKALDKHKGAITYAAHEFLIDQEHGSRP